ncbi:MAG TPA: DUF2892 domain-containing protein [Cryomorphaceae bacterium]|nr:DUF2892 domain-containing protein [Cryomorphaceae bacterium]
MTNQNHEEQSGEVSAGMRNLHGIDYNSCSNCGVFIKIKKQVMKKNMGSADKIIRVILAVGIAALYFTGVVSGTVGIVLLVLAGVFVLTSMISFCPLYAPFGIKTCKTKTKG